MATFNLVTRPYPETTGQVYVRLYKNTAPGAIAYEQFKTLPTGQEDWTFNIAGNSAYRCLIVQVVGGSVTQVFDDFTFSVGTSGVSIKRPVMLQVSLSKLPGTTTTWDGGLPTVTFTDFIGWDLQTVNRDGYGLMRIEAQSDGTAPANIRFDTGTGVLELMAGGDTFMDGEIFTFTFLNKLGNSGVDEAKGDIFNGIRVIGTDTVLTAGDMGKKIIIEGVTSNLFVKVTLPPIATVVPGRLVYFESGLGGHSCMQVASMEGNNINFPAASQPDIYLCNGETLMMYRHQTSTYDVWRVHSFTGNLTTVGEALNEDAVIANTINKVALDGTETNYYENARLYYAYVVKLPVGQVCSYADHATGDNKYKFSTADSVGNFFLPDRRGMHIKQTQAGVVAGIFNEQSIEGHGHGFGADIYAAGSPGGGSTPANLTHGGGVDRLIIAGVTQTYGSELTQPKNVTENRYIRR